MHKLVETLEKHKKRILIIVFIGVAAAVAIHLGADEELVALFGLVVGVLSQVFTSILALIGLIPLIGPVLVKLLSIPVFWIVNALGNFLSALAVKQGYGKQVGSSKVLVMILFLGLVIGYFLGRYFPI